MRVLIAEDDTVSRRILETLLRNWGHEVITTLDGEEAWQALHELNAPALAILDVMMPGVDGLEICRRVRELGGATPPYIILLTAKHGARAIVDGMEAGADEAIRTTGKRSRAISPIIQKLNSVTASVPTVTKPLLKISSLRFALWSNHQFKKVCERR